MFSGLNLLFIEQISFVFSSFLPPGLGFAQRIRVDYRLEFRHELVKPSNFTTTNISNTLFVIG